MIRREKQHSCPGCCLPLKPKGDVMPMEKNQLVPLTITALSSDGCEMCIRDSDGTLLWK